jgi:hypothetical protein
MLYILFIFAGILLTSATAKETDRITKLTKEADVILSGKVSEKKSAWNADKTRIYTRVSLKVDESLKGKINEAAVEVTYPGGEVGDVGELYTHMPRFEANEQVLVFLKRDNKSAGYKVLHGEDGKISVLQSTYTKDEATKSQQHVKEIKKQIKAILNEK